MGDAWGAMAEMVSALHMISMMVSLLPVVPVVGSLMLATVVNVGSLALTLVISWGARSFLALRRILGAMGNAL